MNNLPSSTAEDRCPFIDFYCSRCECVWPSTYGGLFQLLRAERIPCINCNAHLHAAFDQRMRIKYALARHSLKWSFMVVGALIGTVAVGAVFEWVGNLAGNMMLVAIIFGVWAFKVTFVGHKIFDVRLEEV